MILIAARVWFWLNVISALLNLSYCGYVYADQASQFPWLNLFGGGVNVGVAIFIWIVLLREVRS